MLGLIFKLIEYMMYLFAGGYFISSAVKCFKTEQWYMFGFDMMVSIYLVVSMIFNVIVR